MAEKLRDLEKAAYRHPAPDVLATPLRDAGPTQRGLIERAHAVGMATELTASIGHSQPRWQKRRPTDDETHFFSRRVVTVRLGAWVDGDIPEAGLVWFAVAWIGRDAPSGVARFVGWPPRVISVTELRTLLDEMSAS